MTTPKLPPEMLAKVDQWLAGGIEKWAGPLAAVRRAMAGPTPENELAVVVLTLANQAVLNPDECLRLSSGYILALRQLARLQDQLAAAEARPRCYMPGCGTNAACWACLGREKQP